GVFAVAGLASKFHLVWPLPFLCAADLAFAARGSSARRGALACYCAGAALALAAASLLLDWRDFFAYWDVGGMQGGVAAGANGLI
ncbi:hypothetical protein ABTF54_19760, partial [Acinetobacter baumannii]